MQYKRPLPNDSLIAVKDFDFYPEFHNYEKKIKKLGQKGILKIREEYAVNIVYDDWCDIYNKDRCNCDPDIINALTGKSFEL